MFFCCFFLFSRPSKRKREPRRPVRNKRQKIKPTQPDSSDGGGSGGSGGGGSSSRAEGGRASGSGTTPSTVTVVPELPPELWLIVFKHHVELYGPLPFLCRWVYLSLNLYVEYYGPVSVGLLVIKPLCRVLRPCVGGFTCH